MKISLFYKKGKIAAEYISNLEDIATKKGFEIDNEQPEVVIFIGGDGTFLEAVQHYIDSLESISFIGLCKGHLGFFYSYNENEFEELLSDLKKVDCKSNTYRLLKATFEDKEIYAVNEIRIESPFHSLISDVLVNEEYLETFRGNGLAVCSSIGSSAYNKSLGGALVSPSLEAIELSEIAPINNRVYRSLKSSFIVDGGSEIILKPHTNNFLIGYDHLVSEKNNAKEIRLSLSNKSACLLNRKGHTYVGLINKTFIEK